MVGRDTRVRDDEIGYLPSLGKVLGITGIAIAEGISVKAPGLPASPDRSIGITLMGTLALDGAIIIVTDYVPSSLK